MDPKQCLKTQMIFGITGNIHKDRLWEPVADLANWLSSRRIAFLVHPRVAEGLLARKLVSPDIIKVGLLDNFHDAVDVMLSFGGDGTLLNTVHEIERLGTPILGVNIGRLGFLADIEVGQVKEAVQSILMDRYRIEQRMVLKASIDQTPEPSVLWSMNEFAIQKGAETGLLSIEVTVDDALLNTYWADGLIVSTPTGSTAYSLAVGGPILVPGCGAIVLTPMAPHALTARPIVLSDAAVLKIRAFNEGHPYFLTADGKSRTLAGQDECITIKRAEHTVNLVKMAEQDYFGTLRSKLMWGVRKT